MRWGYDAVRWLSCFCFAFLFVLPFFPIKNASRRHTHALTHKHSVDWFIDILRVANYYIHINDALQKSTASSPPFPFLTPSHFSSFQSQKSSSINHTSATLSFPSFLPFSFARSRFVAYGDISKWRVEEYKTKSRKHASSVVLEICVSGAPRIRIPRLDKMNDPEFDSFINRLRESIPEIR